MKSLSDGSWKLLGVRIFGSSDLRSVREMSSSEINRGPEEMQISGVLWKKAHRMGYMKRYMSVNRQNFVYFNKEGDSFPLGFIQVTGIIDIRDGSNEKRFEIISNGQSLKLQASTKKIADTWKAILRAIVKENDSRVQEMKFEGRRTGAVSPRWKKEFWKVDNRLQRIAIERNAGTTLLSQAALSLFKTALQKPRLMKKLLSDFNEDLKLLKVLVCVMLEKESHQDPYFPEEGTMESKPRISATFWTYKTSFMSDEPIEFCLNSEATSPVAQSNERACELRASVKGHRRSRTSSRNFQSFSLTNSERKQRQHSRSNSVHLSRFIADLAMEDNNPLNGAINNSDYTSQWYVKIRSKRSEMTLVDCVTSPNDSQLFEVYLTKIFREDYLVYVREALLFQKGKNIVGRPFNSEKELREAGSGLIDKYLDIEDVDSEEVEACQRALSSDEPSTAMDAWIDSCLKILATYYKFYRTDEFCLNLSQSDGPFRESKICDMIEKGEIDPATLIWNNEDDISLSRWIRASDCESFRESVDISQRGGQLSAVEIDHLYECLTSNQGPAQILAEGLRCESLAIRALCFRLLWLVLRAMHTSSNSTTILPEISFVDFLANLAEAAASKVQYYVVDDHFCLMAMIFNPCKMYSSDFDSGSTLLKPGRSVYNPGLWLAVCHNLHGTQVFPRLKCFQDIYYRLLTSKTASLSFLENRNWQMWVLPLFFDLGPSQENTNTSQMKKVVIGMICHLIFTTVNHRGCREFCHELRMMIAAALSVCSESSGYLVRTILSSLAFRFASEVTKWVEIDSSSPSPSSSSPPSSAQIEKYRCLQHFLRLTISLALGVSGEKLSVSGSLKTYRYLPKEASEWHESKRRNNKVGPSSPVHSRGKNRFSKTIKAKALRNRLSHSETARIHEGGQPCNDQQLLYMLKVYHFSQESEDHASENTRMSRRILSSQYVGERNTCMGVPCCENAKETEEARAEHLRLDHRNLGLSPSDIHRTLLRRLAEMRRSLERFNDTNHICQDEFFREDLMLKAFGYRWKIGLKAYVAIFTSIQKCFFLMKKQDDKLAAGSSPTGRHSRHDSACKRARHELTNMVTFVNDTIGFCQLLGQLWRLLTPEQIKALAIKFVSTSDSSKRRKIFRSWDKHKRNKSHTIKKFHEGKCKNKCSKRSYKVLIGKNDGMVQHENVSPKGPKSPRSPQNKLIISSSDSNLAAD
eukprot:jgi/Bigna1/134926/aug1.27_g9634